MESIFYFILHGISGIYMQKWAISQQVVYCSFQSNIYVRKLTLLHFANVCESL